MPRRKPGRDGPRLTASAHPPRTPAPARRSKATGPTKPPAGGSEGRKAPEPNGALDIFAVVAPGLETEAAAEAEERGFTRVARMPGGVSLTGGWQEVYRANLELRCASRVLARVAEFRALHLAQLDKRARKVDWPAFLRPDTPIRVEATCRGSRIYHGGAAAKRIARAASEATGAPIAPPRGPQAPYSDPGPAHDPEHGPTHGCGPAPSPIVVKARIEDDLCTISLDTTGPALHLRGHKRAVGKAPLRETLAAGILHRAGFRGAEPVLDPMCGSGTFVIEAAEIAAGLAPGRSRGFDFERLAGFDAALWQAVRDGAAPPAGPSAEPQAQHPQFFGYDRDAGAIAGARSNAERAGVAALCRFSAQPVSALERPDGPPGLVAVNPPYGLRIGARRELHAVYDALGRRLAERFRGWRVALVTTDPGLAKSTGLPFAPPGPPIAHGGARLGLYLTGPLA